MDSSHLQYQGNYCNANPVEISYTEQTGLLQPVYGPHYRLETCIQEIEMVQRTFLRKILGLLGPAQTSEYLLSGKAS